MIGVWGFSWRRTKEPRAELASERGVCAFWHQEEGWGAVTTPGHPGLGFVHFSDIRDMPGYRELVPGSDVDFVYGGPYPHDGCDWRVEWVRRRQ
jgi:cold shock CspA family protein